MTRQADNLKTEIMETHSAPVIHQPLTVFGRDCLIFGWEAGGSERER